MNLVIVGTAIGLFIVAIITSIIVWILIRRKKKKYSQVPSNIIDDFNYCERRFSEEHGEVEPTRILWELASRKRDESRQPTRVAELEVPKLSIATQGGSDVPSTIDARVTTATTGSNEGKRNNRKSSFSRRRNA